MSGLSASAVVTAVEAVEQALHEIAVLVVEALAVAQQDRRIVRELVGEAVGEHLQDLLGAVAVMEVAQGARELGFGKKVRSVAKRLNEGDGLALAEPFGEVAHAQADDGFGLGDGGLSACHALVDHLAEVVDGVDVHVVETIDLGLDVTGNGKVDDEHRTVLAFIDGALDHAQTDDRQGGGRAGDDDVVAGNLLGQVGKTDGVGVHGACENLTALERAVRDRDGLGLLRGKVGCAELDHFARTHEEDALVLEAAEETKRQAHSGGRETHGVGADGGGGADFLGNREGGLEKMVEHRAQAVCVTGHLLGLLHLADDLCFAEHHGVEAGGHSEGVLGGLFLRERIDVRLEFGAADVLAFADEAEHGVSGGVRVFGGAVDFGSVAGGQNGGFVNAAHLRAGEPLAHVADGFGDFFGTKGYALSDGNRSGSMVETYSKKMHRVGDGKEERNEKVATMFNNARII